MGTGASKRPNAVDKTPVALWNEETFNAVKATLTWGAKNLERGETPKDAADMGKGPAWEEFLQEYRMRLAAQKPDAM